MSTSPTPSTKLKPRQKPACEECRRRKLRCDGKKPRCSTCEHAGTNCDINLNRAPRGPKRGYLNELQSKIEGRLQAHEQGQGQGQFPWHDACNLDTSDDMLSMATTPILPPPGLGKTSSHTSLVGLPSGLDNETDSMFNYSFDVDTVSSGAMSLISDHTASSSISTNASTNIMHINSMMQTELDQLYFDRMHAAVPILHQRKYLSWSKSPIKTKARLCLQYAVWATASLMSTQFQHLQGTLYPELKRVLAGTNLPSSSSGNYLEVDIELAQAWVLTATYEYVKTYQHEACISAGRAFRLVQLMGLHEIDLSTNSNPSTPGGSNPDFIITEEKRRVFWMAFTLEGLYSMRNNLPLVVNEHMISTNLPVPDHEFQNGQPVQTGLLGDCLASRNQPIKSPLNECIMLVAMCARTTFHAQQYSKQHNYPFSHAECDRVEWQQWLDHVLFFRLQTLSQDYPSATNASDPTLLFANFLAQASIVYLWREIRNLDWPNKTSNVGTLPLLVTEYQQRALTAVAHTVELTRSLLDFPFFKIHPFMTMPLALCAEFLSLNQSDAMAVSLLHQFLEVLHELKNVNNSQQSFIELLDLNQVIAPFNL